MLPVDDGLFLIRRGIEPNKGKLALPGGFINIDESWQQAAARELFEETGITIASETIEDYCVLSAPDGTILIFGLAQPFTRNSLPVFISSTETSECVLITSPCELAFPLHLQIVEGYFNRKNS